MKHLCKFDSTDEFKIPESVSPVGRPYAFPQFLRGVTVDHIIEQHYEDISDHAPKEADSFVAGYCGPNEKRIISVQYYKHNE